MIGVIALREWREQSRQPAMWVAVAVLYVAVGGLGVTAVWLLDYIAATPELAVQLQQWLPAMGVDATALPQLVGSVVTIANWLMFTQMLGFCAVNAGHALLHDRQTGTLPFLLLAPLGRLELMIGKVLGAIGIAVVLQWVIWGVFAGLITTRPLAAAAAGELPGQAAWWVAFGLGGPAWAMFIGGICALISSTTRDVRAAQQLVWLVMFVATFAGGGLLAGRMADGAWIELEIAFAGLCCAAATLWIGRLTLQRDLGR